MPRASIVKDDTDNDCKYDPIFWVVNSFLIGLVGGEQPGWLNPANSCPRECPKTTSPIMPTIKLKLCRRNVRILLES